MRGKEEIVRMFSETKSADSDYMRQRAFLEAVVKMVEEQEKTNALLSDLLDLAKEE